AYASAYLKCNYLAAFTAAILNNQPMGFYQPFTLIKDAQRHGLKVLPVDVMKSDWLCTIEEADAGTEGQGDAEMGGHGDAATGRQADVEIGELRDVAASPRPRGPASLCPRLWLPHVHG